MNKGEIRTRILEQVDWQPDRSTAFKDKVDRLINRAYQQLSLEAPYLFFEDKEVFVTEADIDSGSSTADRLSVATETVTKKDGSTYVHTEDYVLVRTYTTTDTGVSAWPSIGDSPEYSQLGGRMIELTLSDGTIQRREILSSWKDVSASPTIKEYLAITSEIVGPASAAENMEYRIYTPAYGLSADVVELRSARIWDDRHSELEIETQYDMERYDYVDHRGQQSGRPQSLFRGPHKQIDAPTRAPEVRVTTETANDSSAWLGPLPRGTFEFCYTWTVGLVDDSVHSPHGTNLIKPRWESAPSPISAPISVLSSTDYIEYRIPNPNTLLDFGYLRMANPDTEFLAGGKILRDALRTGRCGIGSRVYIRRTGTVSTTVGPSGARTVLNNNVEEQKAFHLLKDGTRQGADSPFDSYRGATPDYFERLKETHGYQTVRLNPLPDARYEIECRVLRRPAKLLNDTDAPRIHEEAVQALIEKCLIYFYELQGSMELSQNAERRYADTLRTLTKRYAMLPRIRPSKKFARVRRPIREVRVRFKE